MTHPQQNSAEQPSAFTITQVALGSPLQFEPALGSIELDNLINNYVPGPAMPQQKRAQVVLEFLNSIDALCYTHPVSIRYHVPQVLTPRNMPRISSMPSMVTPPSEATINHSVAENKLVTSKSTSALKRPREEAALPSPPSAKRLPGFSILTRDGVDITDLASRGPKTKEQRNHAALMRKLKACAACKRSKQRCDPSHHRPEQSVLSSPSSATPSNVSARLSSISSGGGSLGSISPQSSLGESFSQSPSRSFAAQVGQSFLPRPNSKLLHSPSSVTPSDTLFTNPELSALPMHDFDAQLFQLADMELDSWNTDFTTFPPTYNDCVWNSHEDIFAQNYEDNLSPTTQGHDSREQIRPSTLPNEDTLAEQVLLRQDSEQRARHLGPVARSTTHSEVSGIEFDIDNWLHSTVTCEDNKESLSYSGPVDHMTSRTSQQGVQNRTTSHQQDYILYPDSPHLDWGLEPHQISRDIGSKQRSPSTLVESGMLKKDDVGTPGPVQDRQGLPSGMERTSGANYGALEVQLSHYLTSGEAYRYLPSPSLSSDNEEEKGAISSDASASEVEVGVLRSAAPRRSRQLGSARSTHRQSDSAIMDAAQQQRDLFAYESKGVDEVNSAVRRTLLSPGEPHNLRPVITAGVDVGSQDQSVLGNTLQFALPQALHTQQPLANVPSNTTNSPDDQQSQQNPLNREPQILPVDHQQWQRIWSERDLRRIGLLGSIAEEEPSSRLRILNQHLTQVLGTADNSHQGHESEFRPESYRTPISSDIPGEDEWQSVSVEMQTSQHLGLSRGILQQNNIQSDEVAQSRPVQEDISPMSPQSTGRLQMRMSIVIALCGSMAILLLWTLSLLITASNNLPARLMSLHETSARPYSLDITEVSSVSSRYDKESLSTWKDHESPYQSPTWPGLDDVSSVGSDFYSPLDQVLPMESDHKLNSRPENKTIPVADCSTDERSPHQREKLVVPSPSPTGISYSMPTLTMAPSTTKSPTTWTTHVPARSTSQSKEAYPDTMAKDQFTVAVRSRSAGTHTNLKRTWKRSFNIGHLGMRITSLTIL